MHVGQCDWEGEEDSDEIEWSNQRFERREVDVLMLDVVDCMRWHQARAYLG